jgi:hypothetical protein
MADDNADVFLQLLQPVMAPFQLYRDNVPALIVGVSAGR